MTKIRAQSATRERREAKLVSASPLGPVGNLILRQPMAPSPVLTSRRALQKFFSSVVFTLHVGLSKFHLKEDISSSFQPPALES